MSGWILVSDRLPERALVLAYGIRQNGEGTMQLTYYDPEYGWELEDQGFMQKPRVTHWMPMPEAPQQENH